jgi:CRISPR/Cas system-associated endonuclease Cas1
MRIEGGALVVTHGFTHYPQQQRRQVFFAGRRRSGAAPRSIVILDGASGMVTFDALQWVARQGIPLSVLDFTGKTLAIMPSPRRDEAIEERQRAAVADPNRTLAISRSLIMRKVEAARETLAEICPDAVAAIRQAEISLTELRLKPPQSLSALRGIEGRVAAAYLSALRPIPIRWT